VRPDSAHLRLLAAAPELGAGFGMDAVLGNLGQWAAAQPPEVVDRVFGYVEWLLEHAPPEVAESGLSGVFQGVAWPPGAAARLGPLTRAALRERAWLPDP
jgi:hypothetical protein